MAPEEKTSEEDLIEYVRLINEFREWFLGGQHGAAPPLPNVPCGLVPTLQQHDTNLVQGGTSNGSNFSSITNTDTPTPTSDGATALTVPSSISSIVTETEVPEQATGDKRRNFRNNSGAVPSVRGMHNAATDAPSVESMQGAIAVAASVEDLQDEGDDVPSVEDLQDEVDYLPSVEDLQDGVDGVPSVEDLNDAAADVVADSRNTAVPSVEGLNDAAADARDTVGATTDTLAQQQIIQQPQAPPPPPAPTSDISGSNGTSNNCCSIL